GVAGGVMDELQGGRFGNGFASAGFAEALSPVVGGIESVPMQAIATSAVGGTASVLAGGKFANGAVTAAFVYAFGSIAQHEAEGSQDQQAARQGRLLNAEEITTTHGAMEASFGEDAIDYDAARITSDKFFPFQSNDMGITPYGIIHYPNDCGNLAACGGSAEEIRSNRAFLVHEMTHVLQYQQGTNVLFRALPLQIAKYASFGFYDPYVVPAGVPYQQLNVEQQAQWVTAHKYPEWVDFK
ncbi:MAG TPA: hypothetical protein VGC26_12360, partial [Afipia sp.]